MTTRFCTTQYELSHGRKPRGFGTWAFKNKYRNDPPVFAPHSMSLSEAKRWIVKHMRIANGVAPVALEVCP